jgi:hypothetical protein
MSFLSLPPELRVWIYKLLLVDNDRTLIIEPYKHRPESPAHSGAPDLTLRLKIFSLWKPRNVHPEILSTSRLINREASHYLYGHNIIRLKFLEDIEMFLDSIGPSNCALLSRIRLHAEAWRLRDVVDKLGILSQRVESCNGVLEAVHVSLNPSRMFAQYTKNRAGEKVEEDILDVLLDMKRKGVIRGNEGFGLSVVVGLKRCVHVGTSLDR